MDPQSFEILKLILGSAGFLGILVGLILLGFRTGRIVQKIDDIGNKIHSLSQEIKEVKQEIKDVKSDTQTIRDRLTRVEVRMEERSKIEYNIEMLRGNTESHESKKIK